VAGGVGENVGKSGDLALTANEQDCVEQLARFFPQARPVRIAAKVTAPRGGKALLREKVMVEYGSPEHAIFISTLPLEYHDRVRIEADEDGQPAEASVVGLQYHERSKAVAVRFIQGPCDWVVTKP
jgi:hypothetical protein